MSCTEIPCTYDTIILVTPFDVVRVRLQQQSAFPLGTATTIAVKRHPVTTIPTGVGITQCCKDVFWFPSTIDYCVASELDVCAVDEASRRRFKGTWDGLTKIARYEGVTTLWRGLGLTLLMAAPSNVVYFTGYEYLRDHSPIRHEEVLNPLLCGGFARALSATAISPIELIKTRLQSASSSTSSSPTHRTEIFRQITRGVREMVASQGVTSLWRGLVLTLWRDVPFSAIYWAAVEFIRKRLGTSTYFQKYPDTTFTQSFIAGSVAGTIAAIFTTPFDVGKTRKQIGHHQATSSSMGMLPFMVRIYKTEGLSALYVGGTPRILKVAPACAIMISSYEVGKKVFKQYNYENSFKP